jgi:hypothetical protein
MYDEDVEVELILLADGVGGECAGSDEEHEGVLQGLLGLIYSTASSKWRLDDDSAVTDAVETTETLYIELEDAVASSDAGLTNTNQRFALVGRRS